ncbi:histidine kinase [Pseudoalteromonas denitrificans]|uniref:Histidine kinase n=1 Tax=Pseudoalteromonas denitrificans DSM 6059 TaxID=1123010 RepID=A0A1I1LQV4_9GAMM|nr:histidine kinase [Pseudoalteromonas denitrificans]SFC75461.1 Histidine kinase [Pseudoalteromonas denitrificans DSM 6059]
MFNKQPDSALNPHFIFNSMNAIRYTIFEDQEKASELLSELAHLLRYKLSDGKIATSIAEELSHITQYLSLEKLRLEERINITLKGTEIGNDFKLPCSILLPIVEKLLHEKDVYSVFENTLSLVCTKIDSGLLFSLCLEQSPKLKQGNINFSNELTPLDGIVKYQLNQELTPNSYKMELKLDKL